MKMPINATSPTSTPAPSTRNSRVRDTEQRIAPSSSAEQRTTPPHSVENRGGTFTLADTLRSAPSGIDPRTIASLQLDALAPILREQARTLSGETPSRATRAQQDEAKRNALHAVMGGASCLDAARTFRIDDATIVQDLMVDAVSYFAEDMIASGKSMSEVMEQLGITSGGLAENILKAEFRRMTAGPAPAPTPAAQPLPAPPLPDVVPTDVASSIIAPRDPHPYRPSHAEAHLSEMCKAVADGADYRQIATECGYEVPDTFFEGVSSEREALRAQAMWSAKRAIMQGAGVEEAAARFYIDDGDDRLKLTSFAEREAGVPANRAAQREPGQSVIAPPPDQRGTSSAAPFIPSDPVARQNALDAVRTDGVTCMEAALRFGIQPGSDAYWVLTVIAAKEIGKPRVMAGEDVLTVANALGIATDTNAHLVLRSAVQ